MKRRLSIVILLALVFGVIGALPAGAQVGNVPLLLEGPLTNVLPGSNQMIVMGVLVDVPPGTRIKSPTVRLDQLAGTGNPLDLLLGVPFRGRVEPGFIGGTAIINGIVSRDGTGITAQSIFVEPAENVLLGALTAATCVNAPCTGKGNSLRLLGKQLVPITDERMIADPPTNDYGFPADLTKKSMLGREASAEGYFAGGKFHYHTLSILGAPLLNPRQTEVSVLRAQCRRSPDGIRLTVDGATHNPNTGTVSVLNSVNQTEFGTAVVTPVAGTRFGTYAFDSRDAQQVFNVCPANVTVQFGAVSIAAEVDIIP